MARDRTPLTPAQAELAARFVPFARQISRPYRQGFPRLAEDLDSAALFGLVQAARQYDPTRGTKFVAYARPWIRGAIRDELRKAAAARAFAFEEISDSANRRLIASTPDPAEAAEAADFYAEALRRLPPFEATAVRLVYGAGLNQSEAAARLAVGRNHCSATLTRARDRIGRLIRV